MTFETWRALGLKYQRFNDVLRRRAQEIVAAANANPSPENIAGAAAALGRLQLLQMRHTARGRRHALKGTGRD
jgi:hypothetical protein